MSFGKYSKKEILLPKLVILFHAALDYMTIWEITLIGGESSLLNLTKETQTGSFPSRQMIQDWPNLSCCGTYVQSLTKRDQNKQRTT